MSPGPTPTASVHFQIPCSHSKSVTLEYKVYLCNLLQVPSPPELTVHGHPSRTRPGIPPPERSTPLTLRFLIVMSIKCPIMRNAYNRALPLKAFFLLFSTTFL
ncbi:unnamed protein product [Macrosiphum euphorbiae]|uniref:Uncharacterized protein n=1 Tax=Macrosiphum euphorbiae TaxID=13131 RepID=A0AAV0VJE1_9HEMI|nr:unnamed protein product [Macrosiphum euphorbiae]